MWTPERSWANSGRSWRFLRGAIVRFQVPKQACRELGNASFWIRECERGFRRLNSEGSTNSLNTSQIPLTANRTRASSCLQKELIHGEDRGVERTGLSFNVLGREIYQRMRLDTQVDEISS